MNGLSVLAITLAFPGLAVAQRTVSFTTQDGGLIYGDLYGGGPHAVVLSHGGGFRKESWSKQANELAAAGFLLLAIDYRGEGESQSGSEHAPDDGRPLDLLGAIHYLRKDGATSVSVIGASMGGDYAAEAAEMEPDAIDRVVLLAGGAYTPLTRMKGRKLFILARDDANTEGPRLPKIRAQFDKALEPKEMIVVDGSAHAQHLFQTAEGPRVMREIIRFLSAP
jgi:pimeloyl-ACP methyl ester carboxylesterase